MNQKLIENLLQQAVQTAVDKIQNDSVAAYRASFQTEDGIVKFVKDILGVNGTTPDSDDYLTPYQEEGLRALVKYSRVSLRGPHGLGKTAFASWVVLWSISVFDTDVKVATTASVHRQLTSFLWPEIRKWAMRGKFDEIGITLRRDYELLDNAIRMPNKEAFICSSDKPQQIEGAHATVITYIFDESKAIPDAIFDAAEGAFSTAGDDPKKKAFAVALSTPGNPSGRFFDIHSRKPGFGDWWIRHVTLEEAIEAKRISRKWAEQRAKQWGENSTVYLTRVLGEFASTSEDTIVPLAWIESARRTSRPKELDIHTAAIGVDVARYGEDKTVVTLRDMFGVYKIRTADNQDTMETVGMVIDMAKHDTNIPIGVDVTGTGAGVVDRLIELGYNGLAYTAGAATEETDYTGTHKFLNIRSYSWWLIRDALNPDYSENRPSFHLPIEADFLASDLAMPKYRYNSRGLVQLEPKDSIKQRLNRSPDAGDSLAIAMWASSISKVQIF